MVVWVVKIYDYETDNTDVYGVYSSLALAGRAVSMILDNAFSDGQLQTYQRFEKPWGYFFQLLGIDSEGTFQCGEIEVGRVTLNE